MSKTNEQKLLAKGWKRGKHGFTSPHFSGAMDQEEAMNLQDRRDAQLAKQARKAVKDNITNSGYSFVVNNTQVNSALLSSNFLDAFRAFSPDEVEI